LPKVARFSNTLGYPMQPFQGKKLKIPHRASSQQTDAALSRLQALGSRMNLRKDAGISPDAALKRVFRVAGFRLGRGPTELSSSGNLQESELRD
ncbi:MAG: hypothetical protein ACLQBD_29230, partial [Syntrophobacteraceae bacterium]